RGDSRAFAPSGVRRYPWPLPATQSVSRMSPPSRSRSRTGSRASRAAPVARAWSEGYHGCGAACAQYRSTASRGEASGSLMTLSLYASPPRPPSLRVPDVVAPEDAQIVEVQPAVGDHGVGPRLGLAELGLARRR